MIFYAAQWRMPKSGSARQRRFRLWPSSMNVERAQVESFVALHGSHDRCEYRIVRYKLVRA